MTAFVLLLFLGLERTILPNFRIVLSFCFEGQGASIRSERNGEVPIPKETHIRDKSINFFNPFTPLFYGVLVMHLDIYSELGQYFNIFTSKGYSPG